MVEYLKFARMFNEKFPGFDTDIHGLVEEDINGKRRYYVDCVRQKNGNGATNGNGNGL